MTRNPSNERQLDCVGMKCPAPILQVAREAAAIGEDGGFIVVRADDPAFEIDLEAWARSSGAQIHRRSREGAILQAVVRVGRPVLAPSASTSSGSIPDEVPDVSLDLRGLKCPGPIISLAKTAAEQAPGALVRVLADDDAFALDLRSWVQTGRAELVRLDETGPHTEALLRLGASSRPGGARPGSVPPFPQSSVPSRASTSEIAAGSMAPAGNGCTLLVLHNDLEALLAALLVANGSAAQGMPTSLFFTFWGLNLLRGDHPDPTQPKQRVGVLRRLMQWMMPKGPTGQKLGKMHFGGAGKAMMTSLMRRENVLGLPELMRSAQELGVTFTACTMSMSVMGLTKRDLYPYPNLEYAGVATFVERARASSLSLVF